MGSDQGRVTGQRGRLRRDGERQSIVRRSGSLDGSCWRAVAGSASGVRGVAQRICSLRTMARDRSLATHRNRSIARSGHGSIDDRQHHRTSAPTRGWGTKKAGAQAIGRSRGGLTTKIHAAVDALGNPVRTILTAGQEADITQAEALIDGFAPDAVLADKGYDADAFVAKIQNQGAHAVVPPRSNRLLQRPVDWHLYKDRNLVERFFNRLKQFRRIATRYDKLDSSFLSFISLACSFVWLL